MLLVKRFGVSRLRDSVLALSLNTMLLLVEALDLNFLDTFLRKKKKLQLNITKEYIWINTKLGEKYNSDNIQL